MGREVNEIWPLRPYRLTGGGGGKTNSREIRRLVLALFFFVSHAHVREYATRMNYSPQEGFHNNNNNGNERKQTQKSYQVSFASCLVVVSGNENFWLKKKINFTHSPGR